MKRTICKYLYVVVYFLSSKCLLKIEYFIILHFLVCEYFFGKKIIEKHLSTLVLALEIFRVRIIGNHNIFR